MSTTVDFIEFVCEQIEGTGTIRYRKMFGEYMVYVNNKPVLLVCDNTVFVKMVPSIDGRIKEKGIPYKGAKEHYILDVDNKDFSREIVSILESVTPVPVPKGKKE